MIIKNSTTKDLGELIRSGIRKSDEMEGYLLTGKDPYDELHDSFYHSTVIKTAFINGKARALFGVVPLSLLSGVGCVWFVAHEEVEQYKKDFFYTSKKEVYGLFKNFDYIYNYADAENKKSLKWLKLIGFQVDEPEPVGVFQHLFCKFGMR